MSVELIAIKFNHDQFSATKSALNIRRNFSRFVTIPEWQRGISINAEDSVAAYAIKEIKGNTINIQAKFTCSESKISTIEVRAVQPTLPFPWYLLLYYLPNYYLWQVLLFTKVNILGEVKSKKVTFQNNGESRFETFELQNHRLLKRGVSINTVIWHWQFRYKPYGPWTDFAITKHKIYSVLQMPTKPWQQTPYDESNTQLPWTEVLDYACRWASRTKTADDAATEVTRNVNNLGNSILEYGCATGGITLYSFPYFNCTAFLERLRGNIGGGRYVNCADCATFVSTFANILGCDLWQSKMGIGIPPFAVNPIFVIGAKRWDIPCGIGIFNWHEVAWKNNCTMYDEVFDACLEVDSTAPPFPPYTPLLPTNLRYGRAGDGLYRDLLVAPSGRTRCEPQPTTRQRRIVF